MPTHVLLTGAGGFVGSHVLRHLLVNTDWTITAPVTGTHRGQHPRLDLAFAADSRVEEHGRRARVDVVYHDLQWPFSQQEILRLGQVDVIMNVASQSHVDRSIVDPVTFTLNNTRLMLNMLELARELKPALFLQMSTDEVYGPAYGDYRHAEGEPHRPSNPYSASKSAQESLAFAWWRTYDVPVVITNTMNIFGETQDPEKFFALVMRCIARGEPIPIHAHKVGSFRLTDTEQHWQAGSRFYLHARNLADAWLWLTRAYLEGTACPMPPMPRYAEGARDLARFNVVGERELANDELAAMIADVMGTTATFDYVDFHSSRPGHDLRYALDGTQLSRVGWKAPVSLEEGIERTIVWTLKRPEWL